MFAIVYVCPTSQHPTPTYVVGAETLFSLLYLQASTSIGMVPVPHYLDATIIYK